MVVGCGRFDNEYTSIVSPDEVSTLRVSCVNFLGVPTMCAVINETTRTIRIESIVTEIVNRIVKKEVATEVPVEKIVTRVETRYIVTRKEVDISEIVEYIIARIKEYVEPTDIINVPTEVIVDETTESIINPPPPNKDKEETTLGGIRDETPTPIPIPPPDEDKDGTADPNSEDDEPDGGSNDDGSEDDGTDGGSNDDGSEGGTPLGSTPGTDDMDGGSNDGGSEDDGTDGGSNDGGSEGGVSPENLPGPDNPGGTTEGGAIEKLQVRIGPKKMAFPPILNQPGLSIGITCQVGGNTIHPRMYSFVVFREDSRKQWGVSVWCEVPSGLNDSDTTISVNVNDFSRWCGLTTGDISVSKFIQNPDGSSHGGGSVAAQIELSPNPVPVCNNNNAPVFTEGTHTTRSVVEHTAFGVDFGDPVSATDEDDDTLEYTLGGTDAGFFSIDSTSGQLSTNAELDDYETKSSYSITVSVSDGNGGTDEITVPIDVKLRKEEFFEVYYAILLDEENFLDVQCYVIRGYGYDDGTPIYVDNYYKFEDGSSYQTSTGWESTANEVAIAEDLEGWREDFPEDDGYAHRSTKVSVHDRTADAARKMIYQTICSEAKNIGTWNSSSAEGISYPEIANNTSDDILDVATILLYLEDDDCDPDN